MFVMIIKIIFDKDFLENRKRNSLKSVFQFISQNAKIYLREN